MKRGWLGFGLLLGLLALCLGITWAMGRCHDPISEDLEAAADFALAGDWDRAEALAENAEEKWEDCWHFSGAFADHKPMEDIDGLFAQLEVYRKSREKLAFAALCSQLSRKVEAMADAHEISWWNLL